MASRIKPDSQLTLDDILMLLSMRILDDLRHDGEVSGGMEQGDKLYQQSMRISELLQLTQRGLVETVQKLQAVASTSGCPYRPTPKSNVIMAE